MDDIWNARQTRKLTGTIQIEKTVTRKKVFKKRSGRLRQVKSSILHILKSLASAERARLLHGFLGRLGLVQPVSYAGALECLEVDLDESVCAVFMGVWH